jgi:endoglucanase
VFTVARAAQAWAAGDRGAAGTLLDDATVQDQGAPSYYGAAWVALGRLLLDTDLLGSCQAGR